MKKIQPAKTRHKNISLTFLVFTTMLLTLFFASCEKNALDGTAIEQNPEKYVTLGKYKAVEVDAVDIAVSEEEIDQIAIEELGTAELDDETVALLTDYDTLAGYRAAKRSELVVQKEYQAKTAQLNQALEKIIADSSFTELIEDEIQAYIKDVESHYMLQNTSGLSLEEFINQNFPVTYEQFCADNRAEAEESVKNQAIVYAIGKAEGIELTEEAYAKYVDIYAENYSYTVAELEEMLTKEAIQKNVYRDMVFDFILENVVEK